MRKLLAVAGKELRQARRDPFSLLMLLGIPTFMLLLYGFALNFDVRHVPLVVQDRSLTRESRDLIAALVNSTYFDDRGRLETGVDPGTVFQRRLAKAVLVIPEGYARNLSAGRESPVQFLVDGADAATATTVLGYAEGIVGTPPRISFEPRVWYNPELRSALFLVPGLIAYIAMLTAVVSTALSIVREKEAGTMEQIRMSPIGALAFVLGKTVPYFFISLFSSMSIVGLAMLMFDLPMRGSWATLLLAVSLFLVGALAFGLLLSTVAETQQVAFQLALLTSYLPTLMLSGFIFPITSMPPFLQGVTYIVPARYFLTALRAIVLKGVGVAAFWQDLAALAVFATVILMLASLRLRRQWA